MNNLRNNCPLPHEILIEFDTSIKEAETLSFITRDEILQKEMIGSLEKYLLKLKGIKDSYIEKKEDDSANAILALECMVKSIQSELKMWVLLKNDSPEEAWNHLIDAQDYVASALRAHAIGYNAEKRIIWQNAIERIVFPPQVYQSVGYVATKRECSICMQDYDVCEHIQGKPYMGRFCGVQVKECNILEVSVVAEPYDKRCRVTHFSQDKVTWRNRMTWGLEERSESI